MKENAHSRRSGSGWRSPWLLGSIGMIVAVLAVNATMVYLAVTTSPGLVNASYYERGQHYERTLVSRAARDPGWTTRIDVPAELRVGEPGVVRFALVDRVGQPVVPEAVVLYLYRPADASQDFSVPMKPEGRGRFAAEVIFPLIGVWDTLISVTDGSEEYLVGERIRVARP